METTIKNNTINYANRVAKTNNDILDKITRNTHKGNWKEVTDKILGKIGMEIEDKEAIKHMTKQKN